MRRSSAGRSSYASFETHETWLEDNRYLNMTFLAEQKKELLRLAA